MSSQSTWSVSCWVWLRSARVTTLWPPSHCTYNGRCDAEQSKCVSFMSLYPQMFTCLSIHLRSLCTSYSPLSTATPYLLPPSLLPLPVQHPFKWTEPLSSFSLPYPFKWTLHNVDLLTIRSTLDNIYLKSVFVNMKTLAGLLFIRHKLNK